MDGRRIAQVLVLVAAAAVVVFGVTQFGTARSRFAPVFVTIGLVLLLLDGVLVWSQRGGSPVAGAPGHGLRLEQRHLLHDSVAGVAGATSYELDLYGSSVDAVSLAGTLAVQLQPLGYRAQPPEPGPVLRGNATEVAQFALDRWRWRVYELPLPTRFAGVDYTSRDFAHLVAVTLSDDGSRSAVPTP